MKKVKKSNNSWDVLGMFSGAWSRILSFRSRIALVSLSLFALMMLGGFECEAWAYSVSSANSSTDVENGNIVLRTPHATFTFSGATSIYYYKSDGYALASDFGKGRKNYSFTWTAKNSDCLIQVTRIAFWSKAYHWVTWKHDQGKVEFAGDAGKAVGTAALTSNSADYAKFDKSASFSSGVPFICVSEGPDFDFYIKNITIEYTVTAKAPIAHDANIDVTVNPSSKNTIDIHSLFTMTDPADDFTYTYELMDTENAHLEESSIFWAEVAGDYRVRAKVNAGDDHLASSWSIATIHVHRLPNTLYAAGNASYNATMDLESVLSGVTLTATNTNYASYPISCTQISGSGFLSYNQAIGEVTSGDVLGAATWHITQPQSPQYEAGEGYFTVTITNQTYIFNNTTSDERWTTEGNWQDESMPTAKDAVIVRGDLTIENEIYVYSIAIENEAKITIAPKGGLTIGAGGISGATISNLILKADGVANSATKGETGYLRVSPEFTGAMPNATVELFTVGYYDMSAENHNELGKWQFIGYPVEDDAVAKAVFSKSWLYNWNATSQEWENNRKTYVLQPFEGYATSQYRDENGLLVTFTGELVAPATKELALTYNAGDEFTHNVRANSFVAPIDITKFEDEDFVNAERTVYIFNTGSQHDVEALASLKGGSVDAPGQYIAIPVGTARAMRAAFSTPTVIAPMQGFCVHATSAGASVTLDYDKIIWRGDYAENSNSPLRVGARNKVVEDVQSLRVSVYSENGADNLYLLESEQYDNVYENGYDARKKNEGELNVFAVEGDDLLSVDATNSIIGTRVGVRTGEETAYTFAFSHLNSEKELALLDNETNEKIDINEGTEYTFFAEPNSVIAERFQIVERADAPAIATDVKNVENEVKAHKFIKDNQLYILKNGVLYTAMGAVVR